MIERSESDEVSNNEADNCDVERADPDVADGDTKEAPHAQFLYESEKGTFINKMVTI